METKCEFQKHSDKHLRRLVELGGAVIRLPKGELLGSMGKKEVGQGKRGMGVLFKVTESGCWNWQHLLRSDGYSFITVGKRRLRGHRFMFELLVGKISKGFEIDHLCRNRACVNPTHLEPVTGKENLRRGMSVPALNYRKVFCLRGHPLEGSNLSTRYDKKGRGSRHCITCRRYKATQYRAIKRGF